MAMICIKTKIQIAFHSIEQKSKENNKNEEEKKK